MFYNFILTVIISLSASLQPLLQIRHNNETNYRKKIEEVIWTVRNIAQPEERMIAISREFAGIEYKAGTLENPDGEFLCINTNVFDCTTFVETVIALTLACETNDANFATFAEKLRSIRYRDGIINGYPSRLHYISEWSMNNAKRKNFSEITQNYPKAEKRVKTINFMSKNRKLYSALSDEDNYRQILRNEEALKNYEFFFIATKDVDKAAKDFLKNGDIIAIVTDIDGLDVSHVGILQIKDGIPHLIHASSRAKKVIFDTTTLTEYLKKQHSPGIRAFRIGNSGK